MNFLNRLERRMGRHYIQNLMKYLCLAMLGVFILDYLPLARSASDFLSFNRTLILRGEIWRLITFIFLPPSGSIVWIIFNLYFYFFLGTSLENHWGSARFNLFYALGIVGGIISGFITGVTTNFYLNTSLVLAFAVLYPEMEFMLFFVLPVKAKWMGMFWGAYLIYQLITVPWSMKLALVFSMLPFVMFFGNQAWLQVRMDFRRLKRWIEIIKSK